MVDLSLQNQATAEGIEVAPATPSDLDPGSPLWWVHRLERKLAARWWDIRVYDSYYEGDHPLAFATGKFRDAFGGLFREFADNWCDLVVDAVKERLRVAGFRLGTEEPNNKPAWEVWQRNNLDAESQVAHTEALIHGVAYAHVWADDEGLPEINIEHPSQMIVEYEAGSRRRRAAALKKWPDEEGYDHATLFLPDAVYKFRSLTKSHSSLVVTGSSSRWAAREMVREPWPLPNRLGVVPVVPLVNRPRLLTSEGSELRKVIPIQDAVNKLVADLLVASEFGAFRQRWVTGIDIPVDPDTGRPVQPFKAAVDRLWTSASPETRFGEFGETDLRNLVAGIEMLVQHIASQTRTPPHYFYLRGQFPSGESIKSAETGLVAKTREKQLFFADPWEETLRLAGQVMGDQELATSSSMETVWGDAESRSESEHTDAVMKKRALGVPLRQCWEDLGYSPQQIETFFIWAEQESRLGLAEVGTATQRILQQDQPVEDRSRLEEA